MPRPALAARPQPTDDGIDHAEIVAAVCNYFCQGYSPKQIADLMRIHFGIKMTREAPYKYIGYAASKRLLQFSAPRSDSLSARIRERFEKLQEVDVVSTIMFDDVAVRTAAMILEILRNYRRGPQPKEEVHIGFAGGYSMRTVAEKLAELLKKPCEGLPNTIVLHALVAGFDVEKPATDPNAFFSYFESSEVQAQVQVQYVALHAPALVQPERVTELLKLPGVREAHQAIEELDLIVTSASELDDSHGMLHRYYSKDSAEVISQLKEMGCVGDMLWLPISADGPIDNSSFSYRAMTLIELQQLPSYIARGRQVILALGPCGKCRRSKSRILNTVLDLKRMLITHLVVDSRTARELLLK